MIKDKIYQDKIYLITGGSACGKSAYAEELSLTLPAGRRIYLATMHRDENPETVKRITRHRALRAGKGFVTIEKERNLSEILPEIQREDGILLEDLGNLVAGEMFSRSEDEKKQDEGEAALADRITSELLLLSHACSFLVVVANEIGEDGAGTDGTGYDGMTLSYIHILGAVKAKIAGRSTAVVRLIAGIPVVLTGKEALPQCVH